MQQPDANQRFPLKTAYTIDELLALMAFLRSDQGCPWDRAQSHTSLRQHMLEEAYEAVEAIQEGSPDRLCDELGDVLMQVVFHAQIASEHKSFSFEDVVTGICRKLISRHTHLFGADQAKTPDEVLNHWEKNKRLEKGQGSQAAVLDGVPQTLPALHRSYKVQQKAAQVGFDWPDARGPQNKIREELDEVTAMAGQDLRAEDHQAALELELGDLLFSVVNLARHLKIQPELALNRATDKFIRRFTRLEQAALAQDQALESMSLAELDGLWDAVKETEKRQGDGHEA